jgi:hypothetical protein
VAKKRTTDNLVTHASGRVLAALGHGLYLIDTATHKTPRRAIQPHETTAVLGRKLGQALDEAKPISRKVIFGNGKGRRKVYAYSVHPTDATLLVREDFDGKRTVGRMIDGKFRAVRTRRGA